MRCGFIALALILAAPAQAGVTLAACPVTDAASVAFSCSPDQIEAAIQEAAARGDAAFRAKRFEEAAELWAAGARLDPTNPAVAALQSNIAIALREAGLAVFTAANAPAAIAKRDAGRDLIQRAITAWIAARQNALATDNADGARTAIIGGLETLRVLDQMNGLQSIGAGEAGRGVLEMAQAWIADGPDAVSVAKLGPSVVALGAETKMSKWHDMADALLAIAPGQPDVTLVYAIYASDSEDAQLRANALAATERALAGPGLDARMRSELRSFVGLLK